MIEYPRPVCIRLLFGTIVFGCLLSQALAQSPAPEQRATLAVPSGASTSSNQTSPLGINLGGVSYHSPEQPFLNIFKTAAGWGGRNASPKPADTSSLNVDENGWVKSLSVASDPSSTFAWFDTVVLRNLGGSPPYPSGQYVVLYDGEGTILYQDDAVKNNSLSKPGRDVLDVTPTEAGIKFSITATNPSNHIRNIRLVHSSREAMLLSGEIFNPDFIDRIRPFKILRFMDWASTNGSTEGATWAARATPSSAFWGAPDDGLAPQSGGSRSVPLEVMVALANKVNADPWFTIPHMATDDYVTQFASLVRQQLATGSRVYLEFSNEMWNWGMPQIQYAIKQGKATWPAVTDSDYSFAMSWYAKRTSEICNIWKNVWSTEANRIVCVIGTQAANVDVSDYILNPTRNLYGAPSSNVKALAIAPYFGSGGVPAAWTGQADGGLTSLFAEIMEGGKDPSGPPGGLIKQAMDWVVAIKAIAQKYQLELIAYEGGQHFVDYSGTNLALQDLYSRANRDPRMGTAMVLYLQKWREAGGQFFAHFSNIGRHSKFGYWGALENVSQTTSPKYDALKNFIANNPCWWSDCISPTGGSAGGSTDSTPPSVPTGLKGTVVSATNTNLAWSASTDNVAVAGYNVFRDGTKIGTTSNTSYQDTQFPGNSVSYRISAFDAAGNTSAQSGSISVSLSASVGQPPVIRFVSPMDGATLKNNSTLNITVSASDSAQINSITIVADGKILKTCIRATSCSVGWQGKSISQGAHTISATAVNESGLQGSAAVAITSLR